MDTACISIQETLLLASYGFGFGERIHQVGGIYVIVLGIGPSPKIQCTNFTTPPGKSQLGWWGRNGKHADFRERKLALRKERTCRERSQQYRNYQGYSSFRENAYILRALISPMVECEAKGHKR